MATFNAGGLAEALSTGLSAYQTTRANRTAVQRQAAEDEAATAKAKASSDPELLQQEIDVLKAQNQTSLNQAAKRETYDSLRAYNADSNVKHLNRMMKNNPVLKDIYANITNVSKLDLTQDQNLLAKHGFDQEMLADENLDNEALLHRIVKITRPDGTIELADIQQLMISTGYASQVDQEELDRLLSRSQVQKNLRQGVGTPSTLEKKARYASEILGKSEEETARALYQKEVSGVTPGKLQLADQAEVALEDTFSKKFFDTDFTDRKNKVRATKHIRMLEQAGGAKLTPADKAGLKDINVLLASAGTVAEELTPEATGIIDNFTSNVLKYFSDENVDETIGRSAYSAYRNALLRSFGGTAMSESEVKNFEASFGTLAQKYPAVITQFQQALEQTKAKLSTIAQLNNPYLAHYYLGTSQDEIDIILARLDENLDRIQSYGDLKSGKTKPKASNSDWRKDWAN